MSRIRESSCTSSGVETSVVTGVKNNSFEWRCRGVGILSLQTEQRMLNLRCSGRGQLGHQWNCDASSEQQHKPQGVSSLAQLISCQIGVLCEAAVDAPQSCLTCAAVKVRAVKAGPVCLYFLLLDSEGLSTAGDIFQCLFGFFLFFFLFFWSNAPTVLLLCRSTNHFSLIPFGEVE